MECELAVEQINDVSYLTVVIGNKGWGKLGFVLSNTDTSSVTE